MGGAGSGAWRGPGVARCFSRARERALLPFSTQPKPLHLQVVDVEWPGFDDALLPALPDDVPGVGGAYERLTGPMYLGEAVRRLLARLAVAGRWWGGAVPARLHEEGSLCMIAVCRAAADCTPDLKHVAQELGEALGFDGRSFPVAERQQARDACACLLRRSARLTAAGVAGIVRHLEAEGIARPDVTATLDPNGDDRCWAPLSAPRRMVIAADGALLRRGGRFGYELGAGLDDALGSCLAARVEVRVADGGAALGAAVVAAAAHYRATIMGTVDLEGTVSHASVFPPRRRGSTAVPPAMPPAVEGSSAGSKL